MAQTVTFMKGASKTLSHALLAKLFKGNAAISLLPYKTSGVTWNGLSFSGADQIYTIRDSFQISQADGSTSEIKIDQMDETIDTVTEKGEWTFNGNIPTIAKEILEVFYTAGKTISQSNAVVGQDGTTQYQGESFFAEPKEVYATMLVENAAKNLAIAFAKVKMTVGLSKDDASNPAYLSLQGTILSNDEATGQEGDWAVLSA